MDEIPKAAYDVHFRIPLDSVDTVHDPLTNSPWNGWESLQHTLSLNLRSRSLKRLQETMLKVGVSSFGVAFSDVFLILMILNDPFAWWS
jgi:hypothetical protein